MIGLEARLSPALLEDALRLVQARTGLVFNGARRSQFAAGLLTCMRRASITDPAAYLERLAADDDLFDDLGAEITVGESYFLRDARQWELLRREVLPRLLERGAPSIRIWSAGCASGEEPYSLALVLDQIGAAGRARILGTDLSRPALARAQHGIYGAWSLRDVPADIRRHYFRPSGRGFEISPDLRRCVEFRPLNLAAGVWPAPLDRHGSIDLILCRNVLIYFDADTVARVLQRLVACLSKDGYLLLGASDPFVGPLPSCALQVTEAGLLYQRAPHAVPSVERPPRTTLPPPPPASSFVAPTLLGDGIATLESAADLGRNATLRYADRNYAGAADAARAALEGGGRSAALEILLVRALANQGKLAEAGLACAAALEAHRLEPELLLLHAILLSQGGHHAEAAEALKRVLYLDRRLAVAHLALGDMLARLGDREGAVRAFRIAHQLLGELAADQVVPASDGEPAGRLAALAHARLRLLEGSAA